DEKPSRDQVSVGVLSHTQAHGCRGCEDASGAVIMLERYALIGLFAFAAITFPIAPLILAFLFRPKKPTRLKQSTYECGIEIQNEAPEAENIWVQFRVQYYIYAI